ncbi:MAG: bifunctional oligoribonuclease/PAP phosphatase NrnA [Bacteroidetes bacterium]|nr:bifunctional oligoribonuclease/PAP phosphatase NrnA [Bacteroidota bacterium]
MAQSIYEFNPASFTEIVRANHSFVLTTHINPDGDALGSEIGLAEWLLSIGKSVRIFNHSPIPENYKFLDAERPLIEIFDESKHRNIVLEADVFALLDTNDPDRSKSLSSLLVEHPNTVLIDHHLEPKEFAKARFIDTDATSTGEMIYRLVSDSMNTLGGSITPKSAQGLYVAIMTDTGSFRFPRTDSDILRISADLLDRGADPVRSYNETYNTARVARIKLIGKCLSSLELFFDERLATQVITQADLTEAAAVPEEVDGFVQFPLQVATIEYSIFFLELKEGWKISFRSRGKRSAAEVAKQFGGNGHFNAAGARIFREISYHDLKAEVLVAVERELNKPIS